jgi:hypothetical protein
MDIWIKRCEERTNLRICLATLHDRLLECVREAFKLLSKAPLTGEDIEKLRVICRKILSSCERMEGFVLDDLCCDFFEVPGTDCKNPRVSVRGHI